MLKKVRACIYMIVMTHVENVAKLIKKIILKFKLISMTEL